MNGHAVLGGLLVVLGAACLGGWAGWDWRDARAQRERVAELRDNVKAQERSMERRAAADQALAGVQSAVAAALRSKPYAPPAPIPCPASGDARGAVLPGLGDRLRSIDAAAGGRAGAGVASLPGSGSVDSSR